MTHFFLDFKIQHCKKAWRRQHTNTREVEITTCTNMGDDRRYVSYERLCSFALQALLTTITVFLVLVDVAPVSSLSIRHSGASSLRTKMTTTTTTQHRIIWDDQGVVSLSELKFANNTASKVPSVLVVGTKRGQLHTFQFATEDAEEDDDDGANKRKDTIWNLKHKRELVTRMNDDNEDSTSASAKSSVPYPIYSLLLRRHPHDDAGSSSGGDGGTRCWLFCGSGDRFITVFAGEQQQENDKAGKWKWSQRQRLGPHTGWVKALAMTGTSSSSSNTGSQWLLHSIGCNCIETWEAVCSIKDGGNGDVTNLIPIWKHKKKRAIESCPDQGSTLSSDLLCLSMWKDWLLSGGVDGRLHIWTSDPEESAKPLFSMAAHDGRVSALGVLGPVSSNNQQGFLLFSIGHDGQLQCRKFVEDSSVESKLQDPLSEDRDNLLGCYAIVDGHENNPMRLTALSCDFVKDNSAVQLLIGSASGTLHRICVSTDNAWETCSMRETGPIIVIGAEAIVYSILNYGELPATNELPYNTQAVVGHSKGLSTVGWLKTSP